MNLLTETADGPRCLSPREARMRIAQLQDQLAVSERDVQLRILREIEALRSSENPELAYEEWTV